MIMGTEKQTIGFRADEDLRSQVEAYKEANGFDEKSDAVRELMEVGLREAQGPLLYRAKEYSIDAAYHLVLLAVVIMVSGLTTELLPPAGALQIGIVLIVVAVCFVAIVEFARTLTGRNEIAAAFRRNPR